LPVKQKQIFAKQIEEREIKETKRGVLIWGGGRNRIYYLGETKTRRSTVLWLTKTLSNCSATARQNVWRSSRNSTKQGRDFVAISAVATDEWPVPRTELLYFTFYGYNNIRRYLLPELPASYELVAVS